MTPTNGNDSIFGTLGNDSINALSGDDFLYGDYGDDILEGGNGNDAVIGSWGNDDLYGGNGNDTLGFSSTHDEIGNDYLNGGTGNDQLYAGTGNDTLNGYGYSGSEYDTLVGGAGADTFVLGDATFLNDGTVYYGGFGFAKITDFDWQEGDKFQVFGKESDYSLTYGNWYGSSAQDTFIRHDGDIIAVVEDNTKIIISLDFEFV